MTELGIDPATVKNCGVPEQGYLRGYVLNERPHDFQKIEEELVVQAKTLVDRAEGDIGAIVLECTNMTPYGEAIRVATGRPVYDIFSLGEGF